MRLLGFVQLPIFVQRMAEQIHSIAFDPPNGRHAEITPTTKIAMPETVTVKWSSGRTERIVPHMLGKGASRDTLGGVLADSKIQWPWILKVQDWQWHEQSNGYECKLAKGSLEKFMPKLAGCAKVEYTTARKAHVLSVAVFARVPGTMQAFVDNLCREPVDASCLRLMLGVLQSLFDVVFEVCGKRRIKLTDLKLDNLGVDESNRVCLLDVETAREPKQDFAVAPPIYMPKCQATAGVKTFFKCLSEHAQEAYVDSTWNASLAVLEKEIFANWWQKLHEIPSPSATAAKLADTLHVLIDEMVSSVARETFVRAPRQEFPAPVLRMPQRSASPPSPITPPSPPFEIKFLSEIRLDSVTPTDRADKPRLISEVDDTPESQFSEHPKKTFRSEVQERRNATADQQSLPSSSSSPRSPSNSFPPTPTPSVAQELNEGVFWGVWTSGCSREEKIVRMKCRALGIPVPEFRRMEAWARRRLPPNPEHDSYESLASRLWNNRWHQKGGPPRETVELSEDGHFMMRCLYRQLPLESITKPTNASKSEDRFARVYGPKFTAFARTERTVEWNGHCWRVRRDMMLAVVQKWLGLKVWADGNSFQWQGFTMSPSQISHCTEQAFAAWLAGYV